MTGDGIPPGVCPGCDKPPAPGQKWCQQCIDEANAAAGQLPGDAITAAAERVFTEMRKRTGMKHIYGEEWLRALAFDAATAALAAAAPHIAAAERERVLSGVERLGLTLTLPVELRRLLCGMDGAQ